MARFSRYVGIDYSGAATAETSLPGVRLYEADASTPPKEVLPPPSARKHWTRRGIAEWLCTELARNVPAIVGIDHGFSFPIEYFRRHGLPLDWPTFLDDFQSHWPTDEPSTCVDFVRDGTCGRGSERTGDVRWLRLTERWTATAKSVFLFDVQGSVAKSTHTGIPWLRHIRMQCNDRVHFWPFDGWDVPNGRSVIVEVYPSLWTRRFETDNRDGDRHAAYSAAAWLRRADQNGSLPAFLSPPLKPEERDIATVEGWILGVV